MLIAFLIFLVYLPTFSGKFILDDRPLIERNAFVKSLHLPISYLALEDGVTDECSPVDYHIGYYRPLLYFSYTVDHELWGMSAPGFRTTNVFLHILSCFLLFKFLQILINNRSAALWAVLIFALHPVNTESVSWIGSRDNILVTLFSISSLIFYIKGWEDGSRLNRMASVFAFALALLSKEMGIMALPLFFLYQRLLSQTKRSVYSEVVSYLPFIIVMAAYFFLRKTVIGAYATQLQVDDLWKSLCFAPYVVLWNLKLIFLPHRLHSFVVNYPSTYFNWQFLAGFFYMIFLGVFLWEKRKNSIVIFSVLSFHVILFPTLNIIPTSAVSLVSMRWLYFPMAFLIIGFALSINRFLKVNRFVFSSSLCVILIYLGSYSYVLNSSLWNNEDNFFTQEVTNFDNYFYAGGFAENLLEKKKYQDAEKFFQISITKYPFSATNYLNYSALLLDTGRTDMGLIYLKKAEDLFMVPTEKGRWFNNMGVAYFHLGKRDESFKYFLWAVMHCPRNIQYRSNLGATYIARGDYLSASTILKKGLEISPESIKLRKNLTVTYIKMKRYGDAIRVLQKIPRKERGKHGLQEVLEKAQKELLNSDDISEEKAVRRP